MYLLDWWLNNCCTLTLNFEVHMPRSPWRTQHLSADWHSNVIAAAVPAASFRPVVRSCCQLDHTSLRVSDLLLELAVFTEETRRTWLRFQFSATPNRSTVLWLSIALTCDRCRCRNSTASSSNCATVLWTWCCCAKPGNSPLTCRRLRRHRARSSAISWRWSFSSCQPRRSRRRRSSRHRHITVDVWVCRRPYFVRPVNLSRRRDLPRRPSDRQLLRRAFGYSRSPVDIWWPILLTRNFLKCYGLVQHVTGATDDAGWTIDVVCTRCDLPPPTVDIIDVGLSDRRLLRWESRLHRSPPVYTGGHSMLLRFRQACLRRSVRRATFEPWWWCRGPAVQLDN